MKPKRRGAYERKERKGLAPGTSILSCLSGIPRSTTSSLSGDDINTTNIDANGEASEAETEAPINGAVPEEQEKEKMTFKEFMREELAKKKKIYYETNFHVDIDTEEGKEIVNRYPGLYLAVLFS